MAGTVNVREFRSEAEMRAHYAALQRRTFAPRSAPIVAPVERKVRGIVA